MLAQEVEAAGMAENNADFELHLKMKVCIKSMINDGFHLMKYMGSLK